MRIQMSKSVGLDMKWTLRCQLPSEESAMCNERENVYTRKELEIFPSRLGPSSQVSFHCKQIDFSYQLCLHCTVLRTEVKLQYISILKFHKAILPVKTGLHQ